MGICKHQKLKQEAAGVIDSAGEMVTALAHKASDAANDAKAWVAPKLEEAAERIAPLAEDAKEAAQSAFADVKEKASAASSQALALAEEKKVEVVKLSKRAQKKAAKKAAVLEKKASKELARLQKELAKAAGAKKEHKSRKGLITLLLAGAASAAGYVLWKRSQPVEDPWAEAYWEDFADEAMLSAETADHAADAAQEISEEEAEA